MKARASEATLRRGEDFGPSIGLKLGIGAAHGLFCNAVKENERSLNKYHYTLLSIPASKICVQL